PCSVRLYTAYQKAMVKRAYGCVRNFSDVEDVVSDCWVSILGQAMRLCHMDNKARSTYIMRSLNHKVIDFIRVSRRENLSVLFVKAPEMLPRTPSVPSPDEALLHLEAMSESKRLLNANEWEVVRMRCLGLGFKKIAHDLR
ncbi:MAG: sigma-70 family RNA polymerase sigma factor, partial [Raoultibacter sp.]